MEYDVYCDFHSFVSESFPALELDGIIYLKADPEVCLERLQTRNRAEETNVSIEYLRSLGRRHDDWLVAKTATCPGFPTDLPVLQLDCNPNFLDDEAKCDEMMARVTAFSASIGSRHAEPPGGEGAAEQ